MGFKLLVGQTIQNITKLHDYLKPFGFILAGMYNKYLHKDNKVELSHFDLL